MTKRKKWVEGGIKKSGSNRERERARGGVEGRNEDSRMSERAVLWNNMNSVQVYTAAAGPSPLILCGVELKLFRGFLSCRLHYFRL